MLTEEQLQYIDKCKRETEERIRVDILGHDELGLVAEAFLHVLRNTLTGVAIEARRNGMSGDLIAEAMRRAAVGLGELMTVEKRCSDSLFPEKTKC